MVDQSCRHGDVPPCLRAYAVLLGEAPQTCTLFETYQSSLDCSREGQAQEYAALLAGRVAWRAAQGRTSVTAKKAGQYIPERTNGSVGSSSHI